MTLDYQKPRKPAEPGASSPAESLALTSTLIWSVGFVFYMFAGFWIIGFFVNRGAPNAFDPTLTLICVMVGVGLGAILQFLSALGRFLVNRPR